MENLNNSIVTINNSLELYNSKNYLINRNSEDIDLFCFNLIEAALLFKNVNKTENEAKIIAVQFRRKIERTYSHITLERIEQVLFDANYGEESYVSVNGLVKCLEKFELNRDCIENKKKEIEQDQQKLDELRRLKWELEHKEYIKQENIEKRINERYEQWKATGNFFDFNNETWQYIFENGLYDWSDAEIKHCEEIAVIKTRERLEQMKSRAKKYHDNDRIIRLNDIILNSIKKESLFEKMNKYQLTIVYFKNKDN